MDKNNNIKYYKRENGGIVCVVNNALVYSLDQDGEWVRNQYLFSMFVDGMIDFQIITEEDVQKIIRERQSGSVNRI